MPRVVDRVSENGLNFEIFDDGDCVLTNSPVGFVQFSAALIARLARTPGAAAQPKNTSAPDTVAPSNLASAPAPAMSPSEYSGKQSSAVRRFNIHKLPDASGWQCTLVDEDNHSVTQVYESRT